MATFVLVVESGVGPGGDIVIEPGEIASVGRAEDARVRLSEDDKKVSRYHAVLEARVDGIAVRDLGSRNGTFVNDAQVKSAQLREGDRLRIGKTVFRVRGSHAAVARGPAATEDDDVPLQMPPTIVAPGTPVVDAPCNVCGAFGVARAPSPWPGARPLCAKCAESRRAMATRPSDRAAIGAFEVIRFLAVGGMGAVYEARHAESGVHAAVKILRSDTPLTPMFLRRFLKEQRVVMQLSHPHIVRAFDAGLDPRTREPYIATEFVTGGDLEAMSSTACNERMATEIAGDLFDALGYGHTNGFLHRDVKPANVLLAVEGGRLRGKLNDFGLAKSFRDAGGTSITEDGEAAGSVLFMAPEQLLHFKTVGPSADVYGAAATLFCLLTGRSPLQLSTQGEVTMATACAATLDVARVPVRTLRPDLSPALAEWIDRLVARDPAAREVTHATKVADALRALTRA